ncbi:2OG-Fe(II) oxygenase [Paraglaciecola sp.]|uniref:2OG-Fe(II) oxygenase n=1 Tax=Paraglaciecola sp. TaxID=1920173 RepID=UPI003EF321B1
MINFEYLESNISKFKNEFSDNNLFNYIIIDGFCDNNLLLKAVSQIPDPIDSSVEKSRDFIFAKNKYEKSGFEEISPEFSILKNDFFSNRFNSIIQEITGRDVFVDPSFHGGGLHQGGKDSYLNMHVDFNYHPLNENWFRDVNILLYLNENWKKEYGGELKLRNGLKKGSKPVLIEPIFNRAVIMLTRDYTFHGYDKINFPEGQYRRSIAAYGYSVQEPTEEARTTVWYPENVGFVKKLLGIHMPKIIKYKSKILGSGTKKNK